MVMKLWCWIQNFIKENPIWVIAVLATWIKLIVLDQIMFDDPKDLSVLIFSVFTACSAALIYLPGLLFERFRLLATLIINLAFSLTIWADLVYFRYFGSLIKVEALSIAGQATEVSGSVLMLISPTDILFFLDVILLTIYLFIRHKKNTKTKPIKERLITATIILFVILTPIGVIFARDYREHLRIFIYRNYDINTISFRYGALGAHGVNTYRFILKMFEKLDSDERSRAIKWIEESAIGQELNEYTNTAKGKNVFIIQLESLHTFAIGKEYQGIEVTPTLNSIIAESFYLPNGKSAIGGGTTSDSDFTTNTSIYPLADESAMVQYGGDDFTSLPKALKSSGYTANAYHAYRRDFWNRGVAFNSLGFDHFFAKDEYQDGQHVVMGLNDESFYRQTLEKIVVDPERPSFNYLISLSNHHPFWPHPLFEKLPIEGVDPYSATYNYMKSVRYTDYALGVFIDELKARELYDDSLIIIYGDHPARITDLQDARTEKIIGKLTPEQLVAVPFIYKLPNQQKSLVLDHETSQLDIMPTVLNLAGISTNYPMFGGDALTGAKKPIKVEDAKHYSDLMIRFNLFKEFVDR